MERNLDSDDELPLNPNKNKKYRKRSMTKKSKNKIFTKKIFYFFSFH